MFALFSIIVVVVIALVAIILSNRRNLVWAKIGTRPRRR